MRGGGILIGIIFLPKKIMKKLTALSTLFALATSAFAADLTLDATKIPTDSSTSWSWNDTNMWLPADSTLDGNNLTFTGTFENATTSTMDADITANDVVFSVANNSSKSFSLNSGSYKLTANSITFDSTNNSSYYNFNVSSGGIVVENDLVAKTSNGNTQYVELSVGGKKLTVKGNLYITNNKATDNFLISGETNVTGAIKMKAADNADGAKLNIQMWNQTFGGIDDCGIEADHVLKTEWGGDFKLNVKQDYKWHGALDGRALKLVMYKSSTATQRFEITSGTFGKITVNGGRLELSTESTNTNGELTINGGVLMHEGDMTVDSVNLVNGAINYTDESGTIISNGSLAKVKITLQYVDGTGWVETNREAIEEQFVYDFTGLTKAGTYDLITFTSVAEGISDDANDDFVAINLKEGLTADFVYNGNTLQAIVVPEPATVATIFGAIALALAVYRRRK